jgi:hypothetical protein
MVQETLRPEYQFSETYILPLSCKYEKVRHRGKKGFIVFHLLSCRG